VKIAEKCLHSDVCNIETVNAKVMSCFIKIVQDVQIVSASDNLFRFLVYSIK